MGLLSRRGPYAGRLAFDPDTGFHTDPDGLAVVTVDGGESWRYATSDDASHIARYHERDAVVTVTTPDDPHHYETTPDDPHRDGLTVDEDKVGPLGLRVLETVAKPKFFGRGTKTKLVPTDEVERGDPTSTSHTEAYRG